MNVLIVAATTATGLVKIAQIYEYWQGRHFEATLPAFIDQFLKEIEGFDRYMKSPVFPYVFHIVPALIWGPLVLVRFSPTIRSKWPKIHRWSGYAFFTCSSMIMVGVAGILYHDMAFSYPTFHKSVFTFNLISELMSVWFIYTGYKALNAILSKRVAEHKQWVTRHAATGLAVGLQRVSFVVLGYALEKLRFLNNIVGHKFVYTPSELSPDGKKLFFGYTMWAAAGYMIWATEKSFQKKKTN